MAKERPLSAAQLRMMRSVRDFRDPYNHVRGQSEHGGAYGTIMSLRRRGLLIYPRTPRQSWLLTPAGHKALRKAAP